MAKRQRNEFGNRRRFLKLLAGAGAAASLGGVGTLSALSPDATFDFEEISPATSGITWRHVNGRSPMAHLPETVGGGCAFVDYDNDGWMDLYLVNSGKCDFYEPPSPLRNALYHNNRDGTFTDVTVKAGVPGDAYGMGVAVGDYD